MKRKHGLYLLIVLAFLISASGYALPSSLPQPLGSTQTGYIVNALSGKCLSPEDSGTANGTRIQLQECVEAPAQYWELTSDNTIWNANSGKCLDVAGDTGTENGSSLQLWDCQSVSSNPAQGWTLTSDGYLQNQFSGRCADVPGAQGTASGSVLQIWDCEFNTTATDQRWYFQGKSDNSFGANNQGFNQPGNAPAPSSSSRVIYGPENGSLIHYTGKSSNYPAGVSLSDLWVNVAFTNPFSTDAGTWDYGISFRVNSDAWMLLGVKSSKEWSLMCARNGGYDYPQGGFVNNLDISPSGKNTIELSAYGTQGYFTVNGELISNLDLSCTTAPGDVNLRVGWLVSAYDGHETRFTGFTVGRDPNKVTAPDASAPAAPEVAPRSNNPSAVIDDLDGDKISQAEENWLANTFTPIYYLDVDEPETNFGFAYQVSRKTLPDGINQEGVILTIVALYRLDTAFPVLLPVMGSGIPAIPVPWHNGDAEAVELWLTRWEGSCGNEAFSETYQDPNGSARCYILKRMVIHRHESAYIYEIPAPPGVFPVTFDTSAEENHSTPGNRHPWLNISKGKHAAYIDAFWECDKSYYQGNYNLEDFIGLIKTKEYCSGAYDSTQAGKAIFPYFDPSQNVGEIDAKLFTEMQYHPVLSYFYGEDIWSTDHFCGGIVTGGSCSGAMMGKWCGGGSDSYCAEEDDYERFGEE